MKKFDYQFRHSLVSLIALSFLFLFSCSSSNSTIPIPSNTGSPPGNNPPAGEVWIQNFAFNPATLTVSVSSTVKWTNKDATSHTVTSDNGLFESGGISPNGFYNFKFTKAGTFSYHCSIHPEMTAKIIVQ